MKKAARSGGALQAFSLLLAMSWDDGVFSVACLWKERNQNEKKIGEERVSLRG